MTTKRKAAAQGGNAKRPRAAQETSGFLSWVRSLFPGRKALPTGPALPNNIVRHIYTRANEVTQARLRGATKAVHELPAPKVPVRLVHRRLVQLLKKLLSIQWKEYHTQVRFVRLHWINTASAFIASILRTYPSQPERAAWFTKMALKDVELAFNDPLKRITNANATNVTNAERLKVLGPYILEYVRVIDKQVKDEREHIRLLTHKNINASLSRQAQKARASLKSDRRAQYPQRYYRTGHRHARIQRRAQRRQERSQPIWQPPHIAPTPPHWSLLQGPNRRRTLANSARASAAHPAVASWGA